MPRCRPKPRSMRAALSHMRWLFVAVACVVLSGQIAVARQDEQTFAIRVLLKGLQTALADEASAGFSAAALVQAAGLSSYVTPDRTQMAFVQPAVARINSDPVVAQRLDLRLALTLIAQSYGAEDTYGVMLAQANPEMKALVLQRGRATLADLRRLLDENHLPSTGTGGNLQLDVPLIVWSGATLELVPGDKLTMNRATGAFLANFGHLNMDSAEISGAGDPNPAIASFQPFVITADGGTVLVRNSRLADLGFGATINFAGFSVLRGILHTADRQNLIQNSRFENLVSLTTNGAADILIEGNRFRDMRGSSVIIYRTLDATLRGNVFTGKMPTNAIRLIEGSAGGRVTGNIILGGKHAGILVGNGSNDVRIANNIIWRRDGGGISVLRSDCGRVSGNYVVDNRQKGIELRSSLDSTVDNNTVLSNHNAGIWVAAQASGAQTWLSHNTLAANDAGIAGAVGESINLDGNDFSNQFPQFLSGDLAAQFQTIAMDLHGLKPSQLTAADSVKHKPLSANCSK